MVEMANTNTSLIVGFMTILFISVGVYITLQSGVRIRIDNDKSTVYINEGRWLIGGREYNLLFDGNTKMNRNLPSISVATEINKIDNTILVTRYTKYIKGPYIIDTYYFDGKLNSKELFPIYHKIKIYNGTGYYYRYEARDLQYDGETRKLYTTSMEFGRNMKVTWDSGYRWAWVYKTGILKIQYELKSDYEEFNVRLFDPVSESKYLRLDSISSNRTYEYQTTAQLTTNYTYISIFDNTVRYLNHAGNLNYTISLLRMGLSPTEVFDEKSLNISLDQDNQYYRMRFNVSSVDALNSKIKLKIGSSPCFQDDLRLNYSCGAVSGGLYLGTAGMDRPTNLYDNNWTSEGVSQTGGAHFYPRYKKPPYASGAVWMVKDGTGAYNLTVPASCFSACDTHLNFSVTSNKSNNGIWRCKNSTSAIGEDGQILLVTTGVNAYTIYEEAIFWNMTTYQDIASFPGRLNNSDLIQTEFIYNNIAYGGYNLSASSAEVKTIYINFSAEGNRTRRGIFNFTMTAFHLDNGNDLDLTEYFKNETFDASGIDNGTKTPIGSMNGKFSGFETFASNNTMDRWTGDFYYENDGLGPYYFGSDRWGIKSTGGEPEVGQKFYYNYINMDAVNIVSVQVYLSGYCYAQETLEFTDGSNNIAINDLTSTGCHNNNLDTVAYCNYTMYKMSDTEWNVTNQGSHPNCDTGIINIGALGKPYYLQVRSVAGRDYEYRNHRFNNRIETLNIGGVTLNKTNVSISGVEGVASTNHSGNYTTPLLNITANDITRATLSFNTFEPDGTSITAYLSNDNFATWEQVVNGESHLFSSTGKNISARFHLTSTGNTTTPILLAYRLQIIPSEISNLSVDVGADGNYESIYNYELNDTTTPIYYTQNDSTINNYIFNHCENDSYCSIPILFNFGSGGLLEISNLNLTQNINPVRLDPTNLTPYINLSFDIFLDEGSSLNFSDFQFDYHGNKNITVAAHSADWSDNENYTIQVLYSPFNISFPSGAEYWELFPSARNQSDVEPYGQNDTHGIWQITDLSHHRNGTDIYVRYNESINTCVTDNLFLSVNYSYLNDMVLYLRFNDGTVNDSSRLHTSVTNVGATYTSNGVNGTGGYYCDGSDKMRIFPSTSFNFHEPNTFSVGLWTYKNLTTSAQSVISQYNYSSNKRVWIMNTLTSDFRFGVYHDGTSGNYTLSDTSGDIASDVRWYHVVGVWNGSGTAIYVDGIRRDADTSTGGKVYPNLNYEVDICDVASGSSLYTGIVDEVFITPNALSSTEVTEIYTEGIMRHQNLSISVTNTSKQLVEDMSSRYESDPTTYVWTYTDINCSGTTAPFYLPYYCFFSICDDCVRTYDWNDTCIYYE